jgi:microcystin degradation protein MlrC
MSRRRIAVLGMWHETMLATPAPLAWPDISVRKGPEVAGRDDTIGGMIGALDRSGAEVVPVMFVRCRPGGPMPPEVHSELKRELLERLAAILPVDGICLALHGAMEVAGLDASADTDFILAVRDLAGPDVPIAVGMDMHGHLTPEAVSAVDAWCGYRTAPHRDAAATGAAAAAGLLRIIDRNLSPRTVAVRIPLLLPGEYAMTECEPARSLYARLAEIEAEPGVLSAMLLVGFAWNDVPWGGMTALVTHEHDAGRAATLTAELAQAVWDRRREFTLGVPAFGLAEGLDAAAAEIVRPLYLSDTGDNVTAGAFGDLTGVLRAVLARPELGDVVVPGIAAPRSVAACRGKPQGSRVTLTLGCDHVSRPPDPFEIEVTIEAAGPGWVRVSTGNVTVTLHSQRHTITAPEHIEALGIDPLQDRIFVVKLGYLHPGLEDIAGRHLLLLTDGTANLDLGRLEFDRLPRPAFPLDPEMDWSPRTALYGDDIHD